MSGENAVNEAKHEWAHLRHRAFLETAATTRPRWGGGMYFMYLVGGDGGLQLVSCSPSCPPAHNGAEAGLEL